MLRLLRRASRWPAPLLAAVTLWASAPAGAEPPPEPRKAPAASADRNAAPPLKCRIGKPSYCGKYGGVRCRQRNDAPNAEAACAAWTEACLECHFDIPACFGSKRPLAESPRCTECEQQWHDCMHRIDAKYWPNRRKPRPGE